MKSDTSGITDPLHHPEAASTTIRTRRAWWLLVLTLLLPGSAQILAGNKKWGRRILRVTLFLWLIALTTGIIFFVKREFILRITLSPWFLPTAACILTLLSLCWACVFINTLIITKITLLRRIERPLIAGTLVVFMGISSGILGYGAYLMIITHNTLNELFAQGITIDPVDGRYNFLLLGGDAGEDRAGRRPDSISVVSVDADTGEAMTIAIPRNTQNVPFSAGSPMLQEYPNGYDCGDECIINHLYPEVNENYQHLYPDAKDPGAQALKEAVSGALGITIQAYVLVDMEGFVKLIDAMGGIKIDVGGWVPISGAVIDGTDQHLPPEGWIKPGVQKMDGQTALWYGRSREWATDFSRIQRQQCVQQAMLKQLNPTVVFTRFQELAETSTDIIESDISIDQLGEFVNLADKSRARPMQRLTIGPPDFGEAVDNFNTYPDWDLVHSRIRTFLHASSTASTAENLRAESSSETNTASTDSSDAEPPNLGDRPPTITQEYLQQLAANQQTDALVELLSDNGECKPA